MSADVDIYRMAQFYVPEGLYSLEELEALVLSYKSVKANQDSELSKFMEKSP